MAEQQTKELNTARQGSIASAAITANSTAPTTLEAGGYRISKQGNTCRLAVFAKWTNAGTTNTTATFDLTSVWDQLPAIVSQFNKVGGQCVANDSAIGTALLDKSAKTIVATFGSASLASIEAHIVFECA